MNQTINRNASSPANNLKGFSPNLCLAVSKLFLKNGALNRFGFRKPENTRFDSMDSYIADRTEQTNEYLELFRPFADFEGKTVLEIGCNQGYLINSFLQHANFNAIGADINEYALEIARETHGDKIRFIQTTPSSIPLEDGCVDIIYTIDTIEHLSKIREMFADCYRVLKPGGRMITHFQGWYGAYGSHLEDIIPFPWANVVFSMDTLLSVAEHLYDSPDYDAACYYLDEKTNERKSNPYTDKAKWDEFLNRLTIRGYKQVLKGTPFKIEHFENIGFGGRSFRAGRYLKALSKVPVANELFTKATFTVLRKENEKND